MSLPYADFLLLFPRSKSLLNIKRLGTKMTFVPLNVTIKNLKSSHIDYKKRVGYLINYKSKINKHCFKKLVLNHDYPSII